MAEKLDAPLDRIALACAEHRLTDMKYLGNGIYTCPRCADNFVRIERITLSELVESYLVSKRGK